MEKKIAILAGVGGGLMFGVGVAGLLHKFGNSTAVKAQSSAAGAVLLPGERILLTRPANLVVKPKDFGLEDFAFGDLLWAVGMKDKESLGGAIHLTNYRILFKSHRYNRLRGMISIFLPTIQQLENRTVLIFGKLVVTTMSTRVELVLSDVDGVMRGIVLAKDEIDEVTLTGLKNHVIRYPDRCSDGLQSWDAVNKLNDLVNVGKKTADAASAITNPLGVLSSIFMSELLDKTLIAKWQEVVDAGETGSAGH